MELFQRELYQRDPRNLGNNNNVNHAEREKPALGPIDFLEISSFFENHYSNAAQDEEEKEELREATQSVVSGVHEDRLSFRPGDRISVLGKTFDNVALGKKEADGRVGFFDLDLTRSVSSSASDSALAISQECVVCFDAAVAVVFVPCGHLATCLKCGPLLQLCPLCRTVVQMAQKVFFL